MSKALGLIISNNDACAATWAVSMAIKRKSIEWIGLWRRAQRILVSLAVYVGL